jgi:hypothetical protein
MRAYQVVRLLSIAALTLGTIAPAVRAGPSVYPTGVTRYDPARAYNTYVLFGGTDLKTHLVDMDGNEVHRWEYAGFPSGLIDPALIGGKRGHVFVQLATISGADTSAAPGRPAIFRNKTVGELTWDGRTVWEWGGKAPEGAAQQHHDWARLSNGDTLILANLSHSIPGFTKQRLLDDVIYEINSAGAITWRWIAAEHLNEFGFTQAELKLVEDARNPDYLHINNMKPLGPNHWFDAGDKRFAPDNLIIDSRNANFIAIIDKKTGNVVWRLGPDYEHVAPGERAVPGPIDQISGQHDAEIIPEGLPGAGNLLVFDNHGPAGYPAAELDVTGGSRILEIDPVKKQIVWSYSGEDNGRPGWSFYSSFISSARRLPNGNTLIDEGMNGRIFQVTNKGEIVWEYVSPFTASSAVGGTTGKPVISNWIYRAQPVPYDWVPEGTPHAENPLKQ